MTTATTEPPPSASAARWAEPAADLFRDAMRCMASTVSLVTAHDENGHHGMAATAVISVSVDPPSMLVAVNSGASIHKVIRATRRFNVNVLAGDQADLIRPFSNSSLRHERFAGDAWKTDEDGLPYLGSARCALACTVDAELDYGTHTLFVGRVRRLLTGPRRAPLVWFEGAQATLAPGPSARP
jgi:flavin reductase (DIM6/NTAB) family NADH-FMN oxidoreductase RutF